MVDYWIHCNLKHAFMLFMVLIYLISHSIMFHIFLINVKKLVISSFHRHNLESSNASKWFLAAFPAIKKKVLQPKKAQEIYEFHYFLLVKYIFFDAIFYCSMSFTYTALYIYRYLYLSKLVTLPGASGAFLRLVLDQVTLYFPWIVIKWIEFHGATWLLSS